MSIRWWIFITLRLQTSLIKLVFMKAYKSILISLMLLLLTNIIWSQDKLKFEFGEGDLEDYKAMAVNEDKILLIEFQGDDRKKAKAQHDIIFSGEKIAALISENFVLYSVNSKSKEKHTLIKKYDISTYPLYLFLDGQGHEVYRLAGDFDVNTFMLAAGFATMPDNNMYSWKQMIDQGEVPGSDIYFNYAKGLMLGNLDYSKAVADYFKHSNTDFTKDPYGAEAVLLFTEDMNDPRFIILMENLHSLNADIDEKFIRKRVYDIVSNSIIDAVVMDEKISLDDTLMKTSEKLMIEDPSLLSAIVKIKYYSTVKKNQNEYYRAVIDYLMAGVFYLDEDEAYDYIVDIAKNCNDKDIIMMATNRLLEMIGKSNKTEYQKTMIDLSLKNNDFMEANHALEILNKLNSETNVYSPNEIDAIGKRIVKAQNAYKEGAKKETDKGKKKRKKKKK